MSSLRIEIERALDDLISNEEGMRFQGLAIVIAKQRWPELIASERKKDLGLDAHVPASIAKDGIGKALASSLTATLDKIKKDIERFKPYADDVNVLLFATPQKVSKQTATAWAESIRKEYRIELIILPREDIITELMLPTNASICRSHLRIDVSVEPTVSDLVEKAREAAAKVVAGWQADHRLTGRPKISLMAVEVDHEGKETEKTFDLADLKVALLESRRIVLEAPAGRGKTTTLIQLAELLCENKELTFLIDLPAWVATKLSIIEFIAKMPCFLARGIGSSELARLYESIPISFLLNGWNEVTEAFSDVAVHALKDLERSFPCAGIIVATRTHQIRPPLPGTLRVKLLSLNRRQRMEYLQGALANRVEELAELLDSDRVLDDLTRTPLILAEVVTIFLSGEPIPRTKVGVLEAVMRLVEQEVDHCDHLQRLPLAGHSHHYLSGLAGYMTAKGAVSMLEECAQRTVHAVSRRLSTDGLIAGLQEPAAILNVLSAHHVLERVEYPEPGFKFQHQQFQEFYASVMLKQQLLGLVEIHDPDEVQRFIRDYVNNPIWEESLRLVAEGIGEAASASIHAEKMLETGKRLVGFALVVDPVFAADLARLCGPAVWQVVREPVGQCLRAWYRSGDKDHQQCALAGMLASGSDDFIDIVMPLLISHDQQVRLTTYRAWQEFHVSSLGVNWRQAVDGWKEEHRAEFISEVVRESCMSAVAEAFAQTDPSPHVGAAALSSLTWVGATDCIARILSAYNDDELEQVLRERSFDFEDIPPDLHARTVVILERLLQKTEDIDARLRLLLRMDKTEAGRIIERLKEEMTKWTSGREKDRNHYLLKAALDPLWRNDPQWVSVWVARRILDGSIPNYYASKFLSAVPEVIKLELLAKIQESELPHIEKHGIISVLAATADPDVAATVFSTLCRFRRDILSIPQESSTTRQSINRNLEEILGDMSAAACISGILHQLATQFDPIQYDVACEIVGRIGPDGDDLRSQIPEDLRQAFRSYLKVGLPFALREDDYSGTLKMHLAMALARVGDPVDIGDLYQLIQADIQRLRRGRAARSMGELGPLVDGARMGCSNWHVRALEILDPSLAENILLEVLCEPEYEQDAVSALIRQAKIKVPEKGFWFERREYSQVWNARSGCSANEFNEDRRRRCVCAVKQQISILMEERSHSSNPNNLNPRLKTLARSLAVLDGRESSELVIELVRLPGEWDGWIRTGALEDLLHSGAHLEAELVLDVVNPIIEEAISRSFHVHQQTESLLKSCLRILPFVDPPSTGFDRIKEIIANTQFPKYWLRDILPALGNSRCNDALDILLEVAAGDGKQFQNLALEWVDAVAALGTPESKRILLSFVDPDIQYLHLEQHNLDYHVRRTLTSHIVDIARLDSSIMARLSLLCGRQHSPSSRLLLAEIIAGLGTAEALMAGLGLLSDHARESVPYELWEGLQKAFVEQIPVTTMENTYNLQPRCANDIRRRLFHMVVNDNDRRHSAWVLLGRIESLRIEHGRPMNEPRHPALDSQLPWPPVSVITRDPASR